MAFLIPTLDLVRRGSRTGGGALLACVFAILLVMGGIWPIEYQDLLAETTMVQTVFDTLLSGTVLLISIVVSIAAVTSPGSSPPWATSPNGSTGSSTSSDRSRNEGSSA